MAAYHKAEYRPSPALKLVGREEDCIGEFSVYMVVICLT
jgi:hypothetical protein